MIPRTVRVVAALAVAVVALASCAPGPAPTPTPSAPFATEDEAFAAAEATYRAYVDALNQVDLSDPETFEPVYALTTGELNATDRQNFSEWQASGVKIDGDGSVTSIELVEVTRDVGKVTVHACYDVSKVDVLGPDGASLVDLSRPPIQSLSVTLVASQASLFGLAISTMGAASEAYSCS